MKPLKLYFILFLLFCTATARADFNPFTQKLIAIGPFTNSGDPQYDYLGPMLEDGLYEYALHIPFFTLTDGERAALMRIAGEAEYAVAYEEAGNRLGFRLLPVVVRSVSDAGRAIGSVFVEGSYRVSVDETVSLSISAYHGPDRKEYAYHETETSLYDVVQHPERHLIDFFRKFLRYKTHLVRFIVEPDDSLVFVDETLLSVGSNDSLLLTPGAHRIRVTKNGYTSYNDLLQVRGEEVTFRATLQREETGDPVLYKVTPAGTRIYNGERFIGTSPVAAALSKKERTVTFSKEGYINRTVIQGEREGATQYETSLVSGEMKTATIEQALRHKKGSETLYYAGLGMTGVSILFGIGKTSYQQQADLYRSSDASRHSEALQTADTLGYLTAASVAVTAGIFIFSFIEILKYFDLYHEGQYDLVKGEVRF